MARVALFTARLSGLAVLVLGILFWTGHALAFVRWHMTLGALLVVALWTLAAIAWRAGVRRSTVVVAIAWGIVVPLLGMVQPMLPPGDGYGIVRVLHLLVGLGAIVQAEGLARASGRTQSASSRTSSRGS